MLLRMCCV